MATAIQFLRSSTPRLRPNPTNLAPGMPMINMAPEEPGLYFRTTDFQLIKIGPTFIGTVPPNDGASGHTGNTIGEMWLDVTDTAAPILKIWDGSVWLEVKGGGDSSGGGNNNIIIGDQPGSPSEGDIWLDDDGNLRIWADGEWVSITSQADWNVTDSNNPNFIANKPTVVSEFANDSGYMTEANVNNILAGNKPDGSAGEPGAKKYVEEGADNTVLNNAAGYLNQAEVNNILEGKAPDGGAGTGKAFLEAGDNVSELTNDANYIAAAGAPVQSVVGKTGTVTVDLNDLQDVSGSPTVGQVLTYGGSSWAPAAPVQVGGVTLQGEIDVATDTAPSAAVGDAYIQKGASSPSTAGLSWTGIDGESINDGAILLYADNNGSNRWVVGNNLDSVDLSDYAKLNDSNQDLVVKTITGDGAGLSNLPASAVDLSAYAKLNDNSQDIIAKTFAGDGAGLSNLPASAVDLSDFAKIDDDTQDLIANSFTGDGAGLSNLPASAVDLSAYAKLTDAGQTVTALKFIGSGAELTDLPGGLPDFRTLDALPAIFSGVVDTYFVTVNNDGSGNAYYLNSVKKRSVTMKLGSKIVLNYSDGSNDGHPMKIYTDVAKTVEATVVEDTVNETITFLGEFVGLYYYDCTAHPGMGGTILVEV